MAQSRLSIVGVWQKKSAEVSFQNKDLLISAVNKGFNAMTAVLTKDSDPDEVQCALDLLNCERSIALRYDKSKDDSLRDLMYGLLESLHVSLKEWTEERNQVKETGAIFTPTEESTLSLIGPLIHPCESHHLPTNPPPSFPVEPKDEPIDNNYSLPHDYQISASELMREERMLKEEEMANDDVKVSRDSMEGDMRLEDVENTAMGDAVNDSLNEQPFDENDSLRTIQPSDVMDYQMNFDYEILGDRDLPLAEMNSLKEISMSIADVIETADSEINGEKRGSTANDLIANDGEENEGADDPTDTPKDTSDAVQVEKRRRSSRQASKPMQYYEFVEDSDGDIGPSVKKLRTDSTSKDENKGRSPKGGEKSTPPNQKSRVSTKNVTELKCPECEFRTLSVHSWMEHLRVKHSTTPALAGLALLCECGHESLSDRHSRTCAHGKISVIRKRNGPIRRLDDEKATPQCVLCEMYPKTACGYVHHLKVHHKSSLMQNGVYLKCSCGLHVFTVHDNKHVDECNPRQFTLRKLAGK